MRTGWMVIALAACGSPSRQTVPDTPCECDGPGGSGSGSDAVVGNPGNVTIYAHDATNLYTVDPDTYAVHMVGSFGFTAFGEYMTDLGIDQNGNMLGTSFVPVFPTGMTMMVYSVNPTTAKATQLTMNSQRSFNGLSFVPATQVGGTGADVLVGTEAADGQVWQVNTTTGAVTQVGSMGGSYVSSGDIVSVDGFGTVQTVKGTTHDILVKLDMTSFTAHPIGTDTGFDKIWGLGYWKGKVFGFTNAGQIITIDPNTGAGTQVASGGPGWYGAAVTTVAPLF